MNCQISHSFGDDLCSGDLGFSMMKEWRSYQQLLIDQGRIFPF